MFYIWSTFSALELDLVPAKKDLNFDRILFEYSQPLNNMREGRTHFCIPVTTFPEIWKVAKDVPYTEAAGE